MVYSFESFVQSHFSSSEIKGDDTFNVIKSVCEEIYTSNGSIKVNELEDQLKINRQLLNKKFKSQVHYTIKQFIMIVRIVIAVKYKIDHPDNPLTFLAHKFNYTDQSNFNNDFRKVCGLAPTVFFINLPIFLNPSAGSDPL